MATLEARLNRKRKRIVTLSNGLRVANFSSPHPFTFTDGTVLPEMNKEDALRFKIVPNETPVEEFGTYKTVNMSWSLSFNVMWEMNDWEMLYEQEEVHVVLCPLPMLVAMGGHEFYCDKILDTPFRAVRMPDRVKKLVSIDTFTIP